MALQKVTIKKELLAKTQQKFNQRRNEKCVSVACEHKYVLGFMRWDGDDDDNDDNEDEDRKITRKQPKKT